MRVATDCHLPSYSEDSQVAASKPVILVLRSRSQIVREQHGVLQSSTLAWIEVVTHRVNQGFRYRASNSKDFGDTAGMVDEDWQCGQQEGPKATSNQFNELSVPAPPPSIYLCSRFWI